MVDVVKCEWAYTKTKLGMQTKMECDMEWKIYMMETKELTDS